MNMKMLAVFGRLLQSASEKLKKWDESSGKMDTGQGSTTNKIEATNNKTLIWGVMDGPYHIEDFPDDDIEYMGIEDGYEWMVVCKIEEGGKIGLANFWYKTLDEALSVKYYFDSNIEPLEIDSD
jgi:hypothetical protein